LGNREIVNTAALLLIHRFKAIDEIWSPMIKEQSLIAPATPGVLDLHGVADSVCEFFQVPIGDPSPFPFEPLHADYVTAEEQFHTDLPDLLKTKFGMWVVYTTNGRVEDLEGDDDLLLRRLCDERGMERGRYLIAWVIPEMDTIEIN
jgi:hypothetical protein